MRPYSLRYAAWCEWGLSAVVRHHSCKWHCCNPLHRKIEGLKSSIQCACSCWRLRIFDFQPCLWWSRSIRSVELLWDNALQAKLANGFEHFHAVALRVFDVLEWAFDVLSTEQKPKSTRPCRSTKRRRRLRLSSLEFQFRAAASEPTSQPAKYLAALFWSRSRR